MRKDVRLAYLLSTYNPTYNYTNDLGDYVYHGNALYIHIYINKSMNIGAGSMGKGSSSITGDRRILKPKSGILANPGDRNV